MSIDTKPVKVLQLGSPAELYGAERWILALVKNLDPEKITTVVGVIQDQSGQEAKLCKEAAQIGFKTVMIDAPGKVNWSVVKKLRAYLEEERIDVLHTHFYKTDIIGLLAVRGTKCKIISTPHGWSRNIDLKLQCYEILDRLAFLFMDAVAPLSGELCNPLKRFPGLGKKVHFILNGVDLTEVQSSNFIDGLIIEKKQAGKFIIGYIGQLISRKGLDVLLDSLAQLKNVEWELFLIGEGPQREELEQRALELGVVENTHFLGFREDRLAFLRGFDVFVLPSRLEGIPRCLMEAMAAKVPVIASDIPGCNDLIKHGETGLLFHPNDVHDLNNKVYSIAVSKALQSDLIHNAHQLVNRRYSAVRMANEYVALYKQIMSVA